MKINWIHKTLFLLLFCLLLFVEKTSYSQVVYSEPTNRSIKKTKTSSPKSYTPSASNKTTSSTTSYSSTKRAKTSNKYWKIGFGAGPTIFFGDIKQGPFLPSTEFRSEWRYGGNLNLGIKLCPVFSLRGEFMYAHIAGTKHEINRYFHSNVIEFNFATEININNVFSQNNPERCINVNLILGLGLTNFNTRVYDLSTSNLIGSLGYGNGHGIGGRSLEGVLIGGFGFDFRLSNKLSLRLESVFRGMNTDFYDKLEGYNHSSYDFYNYTSLGFIYEFKKSRQKPISVSEETIDEIITTPKTDPIMPVGETDSPKDNGNSFNRVIEVLEVDYTKPIEIVAETKEVNNPSTTIQPVAKGIEYRVQICARYGQEVSISELSRKHGFSTSEIQQSKYNGYNIYTVGSFATYSEASNYRNTVRSQHHASDAFVVAFQNGVRLNKLP